MSITINACPSNSWLVVVLVVLLFGVFLYPAHSQAQRAEAPTTAHIAASSPLPVFVTNAPSLPEGFVVGSKWRFTTWTTPSVITWSATVQSISGAWAQLVVSGEGGRTSSGLVLHPCLARQLGNAISAAVNIGFAEPFRVAASLAPAGRSAWFRLNQDLIRASPYTRLGRATASRRKAKSS